MSKLLRYFLPRQSCFITCVTAHRRPLLICNVRLLGRAIYRTQQKFDFSLIAWVVLPDHFHLILDAPNGDVSKIMHGIKLSFSGQYRRQTGVIGLVWQRRYWDHIIRSQEDLNRHIDYVHYNPVKHGLANSPKEYSLSSFEQYYRSGHYDIDWQANQAEIAGIWDGE